MLDTIQVEVIMKEITALLIFVFIAAISIFLSSNKIINIPLTIIFLIFAIVSSFTIANYDIIKRLKWKDLELETIVKAIDEAKEKALENMAEEVKNQKESIALLIKNINEASKKLDEQNNTLNTVISKAHITTQEMEKINSDLKNTKRDLEVQRKALEELVIRAERTKNEIETLYNTIRDLALITTKITWLYVETKNEFGTERDQAARQEIMNELNKLLPLIIPAAQERSQWIQRMTQSLPSRQQ